MQDAGGLDTIFDKVAELNRQLEAKRAGKDRPVNGTSATVFRLTDCP